MSMKCRSIDKRTFKKFLTFLVKLYERCYEEPGVIRPIHFELTDKVAKDFGLGSHNTLKYYIDLARFLGIIKDNFLAEDTHIRLYLLGQIVISLDTNLASLVNDAYEKISNNYPDLRILSDNNNLRELLSGLSPIFWWLSGLIGLMVFLRINGFYLKRHKNRIENLADILDIFGSDLDLESFRRKVDEFLSEYCWLFRPGLATSKVKGRINACKLLIFLERDVFVIQCVLSANRSGDRRLISRRGELITMIELWRYLLREFLEK